MDNIRIIKTGINVSKIESQLEKYKDDWGNQKQLDSAEQLDKDIYTIEPTLDSQEINSKGSGGLSYWEGSCRVRDLRGKIIGNAYLELTGYSKKR